MYHIHTSEENTLQTIVFGVSVGKEHLLLWRISMFPPRMLWKFNSQYNNLRKWSLIGSLLGIRTQNLNDLHKWNNDYSIRIQSSETSPLPPFIHHPSNHPFIRLSVRLSIYVSISTFTIEIENLHTMKTWMSFLYKLPTPCYCHSSTQCTRPSHFTVFWEKW